MERVSVFWTGVSRLVDWFFSALLLRRFDASTDTSVRVSDTAVMLCEDSVHVPVPYTLFLCTLMRQST